MFNWLSTLFQWLAGPFRQKEKIYWRTHTNPDGSEGGMVATTATIGSNVIIRKSSMVLPHAIVPDNTVVEHGVFYTQEGPVSLRA